MGSFYKTDGGNGMVDEKVLVLWGGYHVLIDPISFHLCLPYFLHALLRHYRLYSLNSRANETEDIVNICNYGV